MAQDHLVSKFRDSQCIAALLEAIAWVTSNANVISRHHFQT